MLTIGVMVTAAVAHATRVGAQSASELDIKVALLYNLAKFVAWPAEVLPANAPLNVCVLGDQPLREAFGSAVEGRAIDGHAVTASDVALDGSLGSCHVLYAPGLTVSGTRSVTRASAGIPVLTVSDFDQFAELGGVANFFREGSRMRIAINVDAFRRQGLQISSRLLAIATIVKTRND